MSYHAYSGNILFVDLDSGKGVRQPLPEEWCSDHLGGFGINNRLCWELMTPGVPSLDAANPVILGAGPLVGTLAPGASRIMANSKFPLTGAIASASGAMGMGARLKWAGYDHLVIRGAAHRPSYLLIDDNDVKVISAENLWGLDIHAVTDRLWEIHPGSSVLAIGPAGENLVHFSLAIIDKCATLGRGGLGAVLGSKNLKAVVVRGSRGVRVADPKLFLRIVNKLYQRMEGWDLKDAALTLGMIGGWEIYLGQLASGVSEKERERIRQVFGPQAYLGFEHRRLSCPSCFLGDKDRLSWDGQSTCSTSFLNAAILGAALGLDNAKEAVLLLDHLDRLGLCFFSYLNLYLFLQDLKEHDIMDSDQCAELFPAAGLEGAINLADSIAHRKGWGELLSQGWRKIIDYFGPQAEKYAAVIRGQDCIYDPRVSRLGTMEFEQLVSPRGPTSASAGSPTYMPGLSREKMVRLTERMGAPSDALERIYPPDQTVNVGRLTRYAEDWFSLFSSLGVCNRHQINRLYHVDILRDLFLAATGINLDSREIMRRGAYNWQLYQDLNQREGFGRESDRIPLPWLTEERIGKREGIILDYSGEKRLAREDLAQLLEDYYDERSR